MWSTDPFSDENLLTMPGMTPAAEPEFEIKVHDTELIEGPHPGLPTTRPVEIIVDEGAWAAMQRHAAEDLHHEVGGIMVGTVCEYEGRYMVRITGAIPAAGAEQGAAHIQFTHQAWREMETRRRTTYPDDLLIGWYHTHPGLTTFFSADDRFVHKSFFSQPWHVALVIDPVGQERRFYRWENGQIAASPDFLLQVGNGPVPAPPLHAVLAVALEQGSAQLEANGGPPALTNMLRGLGKVLPGLPSLSPMRDLFGLLAAFQDLPRDQLEQVLTLLGDEALGGHDLRPADLEPLCTNESPGDPVSVVGTQLAQLVGPREVHLHGWGPGHNGCRRIRLPHNCESLALDDADNLFLLVPRSPAPICLIIRPVSQIISRSDITARTLTVTVTVAQVQIDWGPGAAPARVSRMIAAARHLYLLAEGRILVMRIIESRPGPGWRLEVVRTHEPGQFGQQSFELGDWAVDPSGNLYVLVGRSLWRADLTDGTCRTLIDQAMPGKPESIAAGLRHLWVYDAADKAISEYLSATGESVRRRRLDPDLSALGVRHLFSDGYRRLYLVTTTDLMAVR